MNAPLASLPGRSSAWHLYSAMRKDAPAIAHAASQASKAVDWILSFLSDETGSTDAGTGDRRAA
jgi:antirestriction protein ArdC